MRWPKSCWKRLPPHLRNRAREIAANLYRRARTLGNRIGRSNGEPSIPALIVRVLVGFLLLPFLTLLEICRFLFWWPKQRIKRWTLCILLPIAIYWAIYVVSIPFYIVWARQIGENICAMAKRGELSAVTMDNPPPGIAGLGPDSVKKLHDLEPYIARICVIRAWPDRFENKFYPGLYHLRISGPGKRGLASASLYLHHHPTCTPFAVLLTSILPIPGQKPSLTEFSYWPIKDEDDRRWPKSK